MLRIAFKYITTAQKQCFDKKGFALFRNYISPQECKQAKERVDKIIQQKIKTQTREKFFHDITQKELQDSAETVQIFYQKESHKNGKFIRDKKTCVNKVAHNLHELQPIFKKITYSLKAADILKKLGYIKPVVTQSMAILKVPYDGAPVSIHQDSTYLITNPDTLLAFWIPLQKCTISNGCLQGVTQKRQTTLYSQIKHNKRRQFQKQPDWETKQWEKIEMQAGDLVIFDGKFVHKSGQNKSDKSRYAYTWHLFDEGRSEWVDGNWIPKRKFISYY